MRPGTETPLEGTWDQTAKQELTSYRDLPMDRMTDTCKNITLPQTSFAGGKYYKITPLLQMSPSLSDSEWAFFMRTEV